jgi:hypothetical protein
MAGQGQQGRVETDDRALALKDRTLQIVVERDPGHATPGREGGDMAAQEILHVGAEIEAQEDLPRPGQDGDEAHQRPTGLADFKVAEVPPVHSAFVSPGKVRSRR